MVVASISLLGHALLVRANLSKVSHLQRSCEEVWTPRAVLYPGLREMSWRNYVVESDGQVRSIAAVGSRVVSDILCTRMARSSHGHVV